MKAELIFGKSNNAGVKSGTFTITENNQEIEIDTGLEDITRFVCYGICDPTNASKYHHIVIYNKIFGDVYASARDYNGGCNGNVVNIGAITAYCPKIISIIGGKVTYKSSADYNVTGNYYWYAE